MYCRFAAHTPHGGTDVGSRPEVIGPFRDEYDYFGVSRDSEVTLTSSEIKFMNPPFTRSASGMHNSYTVVPLVQTSQTPTDIKISIKCTGLERVCLHSEFVPDGAEGNVGTDGSSGVGVSFETRCLEWGYKPVSSVRPMVVHFEDAAKPKGREQNYYKLECGHGNGDDDGTYKKVSLIPAYAIDLENEKPVCSGSINKVTTKLKARFLRKDVTVFDVYNDGKDLCL